MWSVAVCTWMGGGDCAVTLEGQSILSRKLLDVTISDKDAMYPTCIFMYSNVMEKSKLINL